MKNYVFYFVLLIVVFLASCKSDDDNQAVIDSIIVSVSDTNNYQNNTEDKLEETRIVADTQVLFFMPSPEKKQELFEFYGTYNQYEFQTVFSNFSLQSRNVKNALRSHGITVEVTYASKFIFPLEDDTLVYDLALEGQFMGYILADGVNMPLIKNGVQKTKDVSNDIRNYFNIANFSLF